MCLKNLEFSKLWRLFALILCSKYFLYLFLQPLDLVFYNYFHKNYVIKNENKRRQLCATSYFTCTQKRKAEIIINEFAVAPNVRSQHYCARIYRSSFGRENDHICENKPKTIGFNPVRTQRRRSQLVLDEIRSGGSFQILELRRGRDQVVFMGVVSLYNKRFNEAGNLSLLSPFRWMQFYYSF
jgi:hypothetical protein